MGKREEESLLDGKEFKRMFGVNRATFGKMLEILEAAYERQHKYGGNRRNKVSDAYNGQRPVAYKPTVLTGIPDDGTYRV
jgi:hypothetical protein